MLQTTRYFFILTFCFLVSLQSLKAQNDPKAEVLMEEVGKKYKEMISFIAQFSYTLESPQNNLKDTYKGEISVKGEKFKLIMDGQEIINNGATVWTYMKDENEVNISDYSPEDDEISPTKIYSLYKKGYKYRIIPEGNVKLGLEAIELIPENKEKQIFKIKIIIDKKSKTIKSWKMFEKNGNRYSYVISNFVKNPAQIEDKTFVFDKTKYKGIAVNDLR